MNEPNERVTKFLKFGKAEHKKNNQSNVKIFKVSLRDRDAIIKETVVGCPPDEFHKKTFQQNR